MASNPIDRVLASRMTQTSPRISVLECEHCGKVFISELAHRGHKANCPERDTESGQIELIDATDDRG